MLKLTLEIVPAGFELAKRTIGVMEITNVSDDFELTDDLGDYKFNFTTEMTRHDGQFSKWPRKLGAWKLVQACLRACHGEIPIKVSGQNKAEGLEL